MDHERSQKGLSYQQLFTSPFLSAELTFHLRKTKIPGRFPPSFCQGRNHVVQWRPLRHEEISGDLKERFAFLRKIDRPKSMSVFFRECETQFLVTPELRQICVTMRPNVADMQSREWKDGKHGALKNRWVTKLTWNIPTSVCLVMPENSCPYYFSPSDLRLLWLATRELTSKAAVVLQHGP